jgi:hypothetical protein
MSKRSLPHVTRACDVCRQYKRKCDGASPCTTCERFNKICSFTTAPAKRGRKLKRKALDSSTSVAAILVSSEILPGNVDSATAATTTSTTTTATLAPILAAAVPAHTQPNSTQDVSHVLANAIHSTVPSNLQDLMPLDSKSGFNSSVPSATAATATVTPSQPRPCEITRVCPCSAGIFFDPKFRPERCLCGVACAVMPTVRQLNEDGVSIVRLCPNGDRVLETSQLAGQLRDAWVATPALRLVAMQKTCMIENLPAMDQYLRCCDQLDTSALAFHVDRASPDHEIVFSVACHSGRIVATPLAVTAALLDLLGLHAAAADDEARAELFARTCPRDLATHPAFIAGRAPPKVLRVQLASQTVLMADGQPVAAKCVIDLFFGGEDGNMRLACFKFADFVDIESSVAIANDEGRSLLPLVEDDAAPFFAKYPLAPNAPVKLFSAFEDELIDDVNISLSTSESISSPNTTPIDGGNSLDSNEFPIFWNEAHLETLISAAMPADIAELN